MKLKLNLIGAICLASVAMANASSDDIKELVLDEHTVYSIPVGLDRVTTVSFPGPISAIDAAQVAVDTETSAPFQIAHSQGSYFFSVRALEREAVTNVNLRWNRKTYVLELVESSDPLYSVIFKIPTAKEPQTKRVDVSPHRLLALLDKAKAYPLLKAYHRKAMAQVEFRSYAEEPKIMDYETFEIQLDEAFRFNPEDTLVFRVTVRNKTDRPLAYSPDGFTLRVGERVYPPSISDASGTIPPQSEAPAYFAVTGTPSGGRNDLSLKNDFIVILQAEPLETEPSKNLEDNDEP